MSIRLIEDGDIFESKMDVWVNPVNCVGVMGAGLAKQFRQRFSRLDSEYKEACSRGELNLGQIWSWRRTWVWRSDQNPPSYVVCFPTKHHWRDVSRIEDIEIGLHSLKLHFQGSSLAIPALGCGLGGLEWGDVRPLIERIFNSYSAEVELYAPLT